MELRKRTMRYALLWLLLSGLLLGACAGQPDPTPDTEKTEGRITDTDSSDQTETLVLASGGKSDYTVVCNTESAESLSAARYLRSLFRQKAKASVSVDGLHVTDGKRILVGINESDTAFSAANRVLSSGDDYAVLADGANLVVTGRTTAGLLNAVLLFGERCLSGEQTEEILFSADDAYIYSKATEKIDYATRLDAAAYCEAYQRVLSTYSTRYEYEYANVISGAAREDQAIVEALLERLGDGYAFEVGYTVALHKGKIRKLDPEDYAKTAVREADGSVRIPVAFVTEWMDKTASADGDGYVDLAEWCGTHSGWRYWIWEESELVLILPSDQATFDTLSAKVGSYTNQQILERMDTFFHTTMTPEPENDTEQSRTVIAHLPYPENVCDFRYNTYQTTYSPSIAVDTVNSIKTIYASYENSDVYGEKLDELSTATVIRKSTDNGATWQEICRIPDLRWGSLFVYGHEVYVVGNNIKDGSVMSAHLKSDGTVETVSGFLQCGGGAPTAVLIRNGRFYKAYAQRVASVPVEDLMNPDSWISSNNMRDILTVDWLRRVSGMNLIGITAIDANEPNLVVGRDGVIYVFYRVNHVGTDRQIVLKLSADGSTLSKAEEIDSFLTGFPTSLSKVIIRYDESTDRYIAISNAYTGAVLTSQRTVLCLASSKDLFHWEINDYLLVSRDIASPLTEAYKHAFQYPDFAFDGDDLILAVRESSDYANYFHDGTYTTFYRVKNYRNLLSSEGQ